MLRGVSAMGVLREWGSTLRRDLPHVTLPEVIGSKPGHACCRIGVSPSS